MLKFNFINRLHLTFLLYFFNFYLSFTHKPISPQSTAVAFSAVMSPIDLCIIKLLKFSPSGFDLCKLTNNRCDFFLDREDGQNNQTRDVIWEAGAFRPYFLRDKIY